MDRKKLANRPSVTHDKLPGESGAPLNLELGFFHLLLNRTGPYHDVI